MLNSSLTEEATEAIQIFIEIVDAPGNFFRSSALQVVQAMAAIAEAAGVDEQIRQLALEFLVSMANQNSGMCRKMENNTYIKVL